MKGDSTHNLATLIGPRAGYKLRVALSCQGLRVQGYQAGMDMRISGRGAGAAAYFKGTSAGYNVRFGDKSGRGVTNAEEEISSLSQSYSSIQRNPGYTLGDPNTQLTDIIKDSLIHTPMGTAGQGSIPVIRQSVEYLQDRYR